MKVTVKPGASISIALTSDSAHPTPADTKYIRHIRIQSAA